MFSKTGLIIDDKIIDALDPCIQALFILVGFWVSIHIMGMKAIFGITNQLGRTVLIFLITWAIYRAMDTVVVHYHGIISRSKEKKFHNHIIMLTGKILKVLVIFGGMIAILQEWGYNATTILAGLGIGGLAIALASKDFVANIFGFLTILLDRSISVGDMIVTPDLEGWVVDIGFRSTKVRTKLHTIITIPNSLLANGQINNITGGKERCVNFNLDVVCTSTPKQLQEFCNKCKEMLTEHPEVRNDNIHVYFSDYTDWSYRIFFYYFTVPIGWLDHMKVRHEVNLKIMDVLEEVGISTAFPTSSIYMENLDTQTLKILDKIKTEKKD